MEIPEKSVQCVVTSPPYWGLRDYGLPPSVWGGSPECEHEWGVDEIFTPVGNAPSNKSKLNKGKGPREGEKYHYSNAIESSRGRFCRKCGAWLGCLGLEPTPELYVKHMVDVFRGVWRVLRDDGTVWLNLGDSYASVHTGGHKSAKSTVGSNRDGVQEIKQNKANPRTYGLKNKDLVGIPWRVAFALRADGWWLRSDIIWCLSGGTWVYAKTQKGEMPMMIKDVARLDPKTVKLWNGEKWTQVLGMSRSERKGDEIELVLRSGERISCTPTHKFPTDKGLKEAKDITIGDVLQFCRLPEPEQPRDCVIDEDAAWLAGLYIAEGSMAGDTIQIAGHTKEVERWERLQKIANKYGGSITRTIDGNKMDIRMYGKVLVAMLSELVSGKTAKNKCFAPVVWRYSNKFIESILDGYLSGDGHYEKQNDRWRLGFTRNYNLERDLRTACSRLGYRLTLNLSTVLYNGRQVPTFRGEIRKTRSGHFNEKNTGEVLEISKARCRYVWDIGVEDEPHLFALASGILTHNSKPNPMPESVTDRPTKAHEYIFLLTKNQNYFFDNEAIKEEADPKYKARYNSTFFTGQKEQSGQGRPGNVSNTPGIKEWTGKRNKRTVWTISTQPYPEAHFATFPPKLIEPCILAGTSPRACEICGAPWERITKKNGQTEYDVSRKRADAPGAEVSKTSVFRTGKISIKTTIGWQPTCTCKNSGNARCIVLDPFAGSGTTLYVAEQYGRDSVGIELSEEYCKLIHKRMDKMQMNIFSLEVSE